MGAICTKELEIVIGALPKCSCAGQVDNGLRPQIEGYADNFLSPGCALDAGAGPLWNGMFDKPGVAAPPLTYCFWSVTTPKTINGGGILTSAFLSETGGRWVLAVQSLIGGASIVVWWGYSDPGTGGLCSVPTGLTFTNYAGPPPPFGLRCSFSPPTINIVPTPL
jgi:hypothetical protein